MADIGINAPKEPEDDELKSLFREQREYELRARVAGLKQSKINLQRDIKERQNQIMSVDKEQLLIQGQLDKLISEKVNNNG